MLRSFQTAESAHGEPLHLRIGALEGFQEWSNILRSGVFHLQKRVLEGDLK
jgi:hypothetical protein